MRDTLYNTAYINSSKDNLTKLPIVLCAVAGIVLGGVAFKIANGRMNNTDESLKSGQTKSVSIAEAVDKNKSGSQIPLEKVKQSVFKIFGIDTYNPVTILNANYPYFKMFYYDQYLEYVAQKEKEELEKKAAAEQAAQNASKAQNSTEKTVSDPTAGQLKEASSSITFEGDVNDSDQKNNPVVSSGKITIKNETSYSIDINKLLNEPLKLKSDKAGPKIFLYHTHTTESFLKNISELTQTNILSRTTNNQYNVVRVGDALTSNLKKYNINVLHNSTIHDADYNSSYVKSLNTLTSNLEKYPSIKMTIDLHRDATSGEKLRVVKKINGKDVARIMFVIGTDTKLSNPQWRENLKLAIKIQARLNEICPGLAKPIYLSKNRYNQHLTNGSVIIEIGGDGNVIDECVRSTTYLAQAINEVIYKKK